MENKLISLNLMDIQVGDSVMTNVNLSVTPLIDGVADIENRKAVLGSTIQGDEAINAFIAEIGVALEKLLLAKGV